MFSEVRPMNLWINYLTMAVILVACLYQMHEKNYYKTIQETGYLIVLCLMFLVICAVLYKVRLFFEELYYVNEDYNRSLYSVIKATINFNIPSWVVIGITSFSFVMVIINLNFNILQVMQLNPLATLLAIAFSLLLFYTVNMFDCRATKVATVFSLGGLDPGTAIACSYFYGYLKIVLPSSGGLERSGILTSLENYENEQNISVPVKKLFILIPSSSYIPPDLKEVSDNWLQPIRSLGTIIIDRAGVKGRSYKNTMYRIVPPSSNQTSSEVTYLATEGATPLKTFLEVQDKSHRYAPLYREYNREIIRNFYLTLKNLLNDNPDCRDYCELVYYEDYIGDKRINPAQVLLDRIASYTQK